MKIKSVGEAIDRVDGKLKVTGAAKYATDFTAKNMTHAVLVDSTIAKGKIKDIDAGAALKAPGVLAVVTHKNIPKLRPAKEDFFKGGKPGEDRLPFADDVIYYAGQYVAMVVADSLERAIYAAELVKVTYTEEKPLIERDGAARHGDETSRVVRREITISSRQRGQSAGRSRSRQGRADLYDPHRDEQSDGDVRHIGRLGRRSSHRL